VKTTTILGKVPSFDFSNANLRDVLDLATLVEQEAKERYEELAHQMEVHRTPEAAAFFRKMIALEVMHEDEVAGARTMLFGHEPMVVTRAMIFDVEAPEYDEVRALMSHREALETVLRAEKKARAFFAAAREVVTDERVCDMFSSLLEEETLHVEYVERELAKLPPEPMVDGRAFEDEPVMQ
jgi:rubrerythrin